MIADLQLRYRGSWVDVAKPCIVWWKLLEDKIIWLSLPSHFRGHNRKLAHEDKMHTERDIQVSTISSSCFWLSGVIRVLEKNRSLETPYGKRTWRPTYCRRGATCYAFKSPILSRHLNWAHSNFLFLQEGLRWRSWHSATCSGKPKLSSPASRLLFVPSEMSRA